MFSDSHLFDFIDINKDGHKFSIPVHHRELGKKKGLLYDKTVKWSDVVIHHVPLDYTLQCENYIPPRLNTSITSKIHLKYNTSKSNIIDINILNYEDKYFKRKQRLKNKSFNQTKKKKKNKIRIIKTSDNDNYYDDLECKNIKDLTIQIYQHNQYNYYQMFNQEDILINKFRPVELRYVPRIYLVKCPRKVNFCIPEHLLKPNIQWDKIWSKMDEIEMEVKRKYHYIPPGKVEDSQKGPAIYFYDDNSDDLNFNFNWKTDFIEGPENNILTFPFPYKNNQYYRPKTKSYITNF